MPILLNHHMILGPHHLMERGKEKTEDMQKPDKGIIPKLFGVTITNNMVIRPIGVSIIQTAVEDHLILDHGVLHVTVPDIQLIPVMPLLFAYPARVRERTRAATATMAIEPGRAKISQLATTLIRPILYCMTLLHPLTLR
jgi:hypothetical protein